VTGRAPIRVPGWPQLQNFGYAWTALSTERVKVIKHVLWTALLGLMTCATPTVLAEDNLRDFVLGSPCFNCHGDGSPKGNGIPAISSYDAAGLAAALKAFRSGERHSTVMQRLALGYSDDDIEALSAWLAGQQQ